MKEVALKSVVGNAEADTLRASLATVLEVSLDEVPALHADEESVGWAISRWLGGLGLGLAKVADPRSFAWPGPWVARVAQPGRAARFLVMFGVPSGVVHDPAGACELDREWITAGYVIAATDVAQCRPPRPMPPLTVGVVETISIATSAGRPTRQVGRIRAVAGSGLEGDRHTGGAGTFPSGVSGSALTLIEAEVCESFTPSLSSDEHRRNLVTRGIDLNSLVGHRFTVGRVRCRGVRLCEPCTVVDAYAVRPVLRALVHRGGLRADIVSGGTIHVGDEIRASGNSR